MAHSRLAQTEVGADVVKGVGHVFSITPPPQHIISVPSDLTDAQWQLVEPLLPPEEMTGVPFRPVTHSRRRIVDAILYVAEQAVPGGSCHTTSTSWKTVYWYFTRWNANGTRSPSQRSCEKVRHRRGRNAEPRRIVDAQSIRSADTVGKNGRGYDAGKKINGQAKHRCRYDRWCCRPASRLTTPAPCRR